MHDSINNSDKLKSDSLFKIWNRRISRKLLEINEWKIIQQQSYSC